MKIVALKVLDKKGSGKTSDVTAALDFAVSHKNLLGIRIVNLSLGHAIYEPAGNRSAGSGSRGGGTRGAS